MSVKKPSILIFIFFCIFTIYSQTGGDSTDGNRRRPGKKTGVTGGQEGGLEGDYLFINSSPIRASVSIGGKETGLVTPCIIRGKNLKLSIITVKKEGYKEYQLSQDQIGAKNVSVSLVPLSFDLFFPNRTNYMIGNTATKGPVLVSRLQQGNYSLKIEANKIAFARVSPFTPWEVMLGTATVISASGMISTIVLSEVANYNAYLNRDGNEIDYEFFKRSTQNLDYAKFAFIGVTSTFACALIAVVAVDVHTRFKQRKQIMELSKELPSYEDETFYESAMQFLASGEIERSIQVLTSIISLFPQSDFIPLVYYQLGQNYYILGDYDNAVKQWEIFIRDYPLLDYYDYVIKSFADIHYSRGEMETARNILDRVLFTGATINKESIYSFQAKLDFELYTKLGENKYFTRAEEEYTTLIDEFTNSERLDIYFLMLIKLYNSVNAVDKINKLRQKVGTLSDIDESMEKLILSYF